MVAATIQRRFAVMGTTAHLLTVGGSVAALARAQRRLVDLERRWSRFLPRSELSQLNARPDRPVIVSGETFDLITAAVDAWYLTGGAFDPTVEATMRAAGYDRPLDAVTAAAAAGAIPVARQLPAPGAAGITLDPAVGAVTLPAGVRLDLGGIAKGAAADLVADQLLADGCDGVCVNLGGDLRVTGAPPRPEGWAVSLVSPGAPRPRTIGLVEGAVCTTTKAIRRWQTTIGPQHHLRHPESGAPLERGLQSVSVVGARGVQCEVLAKALFSAGPHRATQLAERFGVTGLVVTDAGDARALPGLAPFELAGGAAAAVG